MNGWLAAAAIGGLTGVVLGAFSAHSLDGGYDPRSVEVFRTGVQYQMWHSLALLALALAARAEDAGRRLAARRLACWGFAAGIVVFSGSLYLLVVTGVRAFGMITPVGGLAFLAGWAGLVWYARERRR